MPNLFSKENSPNETYNGMLDGIQHFLPEARKYWQSLLDNYHEDLDSNFCSAFSVDPFSRLWELTLVHYLRTTAGDKITFLSTPKVKNAKSAPDFCFEYKGKRFFVEAICPDAGEKEFFPMLNRTFADINGKCIKGDPAKEIMSRITSAIRDKNEKYESYLKAGSISEKDGYIIAISMAKIPFYNQSRMPDVAAKCLFPLSNPTIPVIRDSDNELKMGAISYHYQQTFNKGSKKKSDGSPELLLKDYFINRDYKHISAVLFSTAWMSFYPPAGYWGTDVQNDFELIHNPLALTAVALDRDVLPVHKEIYGEVSEDSFTLHNLWQYR